MLLFTLTILTILAIFYFNHILTVAKESKIKNSDVYDNAQDEWEHIQLWYKEKHPKKALPYAFMIDTGSWIGTQMNVYNNKGNICFHDDLTPSEFVVAIQKIKNRMQEFGYK